MSLAADLVVAQRRQYERLQGKLTARQRRVVAKALAQLEREIMTSARGSWTEAQAKATFAQIVAMVRRLETKQRKLMRRALGLVGELAVANLSEYLTELDREFLGAARPLRWDSLEWLAGYMGPLSQSRLRIYKRSFTRYGAAAVSDIEDSLAQRVLIGMPWTDAREEVWKAVKGVVEDRQWMVDRIVRTEVAEVYNSVTMAALYEEDTPERPMLKKLVAVFDGRTALDSKVLHGQTRKVSELFTDAVNGRKFDHPPNRPNDREIVVGWSSDWPDSEVFDRDTRTERPDDATAG